MLRQGEVGAARAAFLSIFPPQKSGDQQVGPKEPGLRKKINQLQLIRSSFPGRQRDFSKRSTVKSLRILLLSSVLKKAMGDLSSKMHYF